MQVIKLRIRMFCCCVQVSYKLVKLKRRIEMTDEVNVVQIPRVSLSHYRVK